MCLTTPSQRRLSRGQASAEEYGRDHRIRGRQPEIAGTFSRERPYLGHGFLGVGAAARGPVVCGTLNKRGWPAPPGRGNGQGRSAVEFLSTSTPKGAFLKLRTGDVGPPIAEKKLPRRCNDSLEPIGS